MSVEGVAELPEGRIGVEHHDVDPAPAEHLVEAVLAFQLVGIGASPKLIISTPAEQEFFAAAADQGVIRTERGGLWVVRVSRAEQDIAKYVVIPVAAVQHFLADVAVQMVESGLAEKLVAK